VLIIGHSDTVPQIVATLSDNSAIPEIGDEEYGTMYIVTVPRDRERKPTCACTIDGIAGGSRLQGRWRPRLLGYDWPGARSMMALRTKSA
jgi:hypothetical protein